MLQNGKKNRLLLERPSCSFEGFEATRGATGGHRIGRDLYNPAQSWRVTAERQKLHFKYLEDKHTSQSCSL